MVTVANENSHFVSPALIYSRPPSPVISLSLSLSLAAWFLPCSLRSAVLICVLCACVVLSWCGFRLIAGSTILLWVLAFARGCRAVWAVGAVYVQNLARLMTSNRSHRSSCVQNYLPIHYAAYHGHAEAIRLVLGVGAAVDVEDKYVSADEKPTDVMRI